MNNYFACISLDSGSIQELEILRNTGNYADNYSRRSTFDLCTDGYNRGIFVDHLFLFDFSVLCVIKNTGKGISGSDKKKIQKGPVLNKITS